MRNCWDVLEIKPTSDVEEIKRARRVLVKRWHPDAVDDPLMRDEFTHRCAEVNAAYDVAMKLSLPMRSTIRECHPIEIKPSHHGPGFGFYPFASGVGRSWTAIWLKIVLLALLVKYVPFDVALTVALVLLLIGLPLLNWARRRRKAASLDPA
jgi:hypothetical protein